MRIALLACVATVSAVALAACGSSTGPTVYPAVGGQYAATFTYTDSNAFFDSTKTVSATIVLQNPNSVGQVLGFAAFPNAIDSALIIATFSSNTLGALNFFTFGNPNTPLFFSPGILSETFPTCNFKDVGTFTLVTPGSISSVTTGAQLTMAGSFTGFKCGMGTDSSVSTLAASVVATRM